MQPYNAYHNYGTRTSAKNKELRFVQVFGA